MDAPISKSRTVPEKKKTRDRDEPPIMPVNVPKISEKKPDLEILSLDQRMMQGSCLATVGELMGRNAHQLSNTLHTMKGFAELALMDLSKADNVKLALNTVIEQAQDLDNQVRYIAFLLGNKNKVKEDCDLVSIVREVVKLMRRFGRLQHCQVDVIEDSEPCVILCNTKQMHQMLLALLFNAVDATDGRGKIKLEIKNLAGASKIILNISDDGPGISDELMDRIFDPFFSTKTEGLGSGLGLDAVRRIVNRHGAQLAVDSMPGSGCRFSVIFPAAVKTKSDS